MKKIYFLMLSFAACIMVTKQASAQIYTEPKTGFYSGSEWSNDRTTVNGTWYSSTNCKNIGTDKKPEMQCAEGGGPEVQNNDENYVYCEFQTDETKFLSVTNFNFKFDQLPPGLSADDIDIVAIEISFSRFVTNGSVVDKEIRIIKGGQVNFTGYNVGESNKAIVNVDWPKGKSSEAVQSYGGINDPYPLWGTTWKLSDIMEPGFGVALSARKTKGNNSIRAYIGQVTLKVHYEGPIKPLPVELAKFTAKYQDGLVVLEWKTASEKNNNYFTLESSANGSEFTQLSQIKGAGDSQQENNYTYKDERNLEGTAYYRLKQTDFDGTETYSKVVSVTPEKYKNEVMLFPNPSDGETINISSANNMKEHVNVTIYNAAGAKLYNQQLKDIGDAAVTIKPPNKLNPGLYLIQLESNGENIRQRFVVK